MDKLLNPEPGLMIWTIVTFLSMVFLLKKFAWSPLLRSIETREEKMRAEREAAERARAEAQRIQANLEARLAAIDTKSREMLAQAGKEVEALRAKHSAEAKEEAGKLMSKTRAGLEEEKRRLVIELRREVASLSVAVTEKLVHKSVDADVRKTVLDQFFEELGRMERKN